MPPRCGLVFLLPNCQAFPPGRDADAASVAFCQKLPGVSGANVPVDGLRIRRTRF